MIVVAIRLALTAALLAWVASGSTVALVITLALIILAIEMLSVPRRTWWWRS